MRENSILFVAGDEEVQQHVHDTYEFGYWSAGFDAILEKNGFLDVETATQEVLADPEIIRQYDVILVAWLPPKFWEMAYLRALWEYDGFVFIEGPVPGFLENLLGIESTGEPDSLSGNLRILDDEVKRTFAESLGNAVSPDLLSLTPKQELTETFEIYEQRWDGDRADGQSEFSGVAAKIAKSYAIAYGKRFEESGEFFEDHTYDGLSSVFLAEFFAKVQDGDAISNDGLEAAMTEFEADGFVASSPLELVEQILDVNPQKWSDPDGGELLSDGSPVRYVWVASLVYRDDPDEELKAAIEGAVAELLGVDGNEGFDVERLDGVDLNELAAVAAVLSNIGEQSRAVEILETCIELSFDWEQGLFETFRVTDGSVEKLGTYSNIPWIPLAFLGHVEGQFYDEPTASGTDESCPERTGRAYEAPPYGVKKYEPKGCRVLVAFDDGEQSWPLLFNRGSVVGTSFQLFAYLAHFHTMGPLSEPVYNLKTRPAFLLERLFFQYLRDKMREYGVSDLSVGNWPWKKRYCFTLRHDVDRIPGDDRFDDLLALQRSHNLGVSWFWLPFRTDEVKLSRVLDAGHEVGVHTTDTDGVPEAVSELEAAIPTEYDINGGTVHGGGGSDGWLGYKTVKAAADADLAYADHQPGAMYSLPYPFLRLDDDGVVEAGEPTLIWTSFNIDSDTLSPEEVLAGQEDWSQFHVRNGSHLSVLNHPDRNPDILEKLIQSLPEKGRLDWTYREVADWWNRTHRRDALAVERITDTNEETVYRLTAEEAVEDLEVKIPRTDDYRGDVELTANGETVTPDQEEFTDETTGEEFVRVRVNLAAGEPVELQYRTESLPAYEDIPPQIPDDITGPRAEADYLLPRVSKMTQVLANFADVSDLTGKSVLDAGCGYGPFTMALYLSDRPARAVGADISEKYVRTGNQLCAETGMHDVEFVQSAFRELTDVLDERFDVLIVNNSINFLTSRKAYTEAIREFYEILEPGGAMIILTPNRYHLEEAFTGLKGVQFLPDRIADWYVRKKGIRDGYDDIRLPSSFELVWWLRRTGFEDVQVVDAYQFTTEGWRRHFKPRFYVTARKPE